MDDLKVMNNFPLSSSLMSRGIFRAEFGETSGTLEREPVSGLQVIDAQRFRNFQNYRINGDDQSNDDRIDLRGSEMN